MFCRKIFAIKNQCNIFLRLNTISCSYCTNTKVRVRFAPSPTGYLHLGSLRTALYNYLFARLHKGTFVLRIEDTDQTRLVDKATEQLQIDLNWAGIEIDEGPNIRGDFGPYVQSKRLHIYNEEIKTLLANGSAYYCFCTNKRLDLLRKEALRMRQIPKYDNRCRHLSKSDAEERIQRGDKYCIRFKLTSDCETFEDLIYGNIAYDVALNEGDPVIMKADGFPTYHFANVVDDHYMHITHVLRGVEWQISTTKHILMYRAFQWKPPIFGHLPLLMNADGTKLSKRQGDIQISKYKNNGIFPLALVNFVTSCGGGFDTQQGLKIQCYSMPQLIQQFNVTRINAHSTKIMPEKLLEFNRLELIKLIENENTCAELVVRVKEMINNKFSNSDLDGCLRLDDDYVMSILKWSAGRICKLSDLISNELLFLWITPVYDNAKEEDIELLKIFSDNLSNATIIFCKNDLKTFLKQFTVEHNVPFNTFMKIMRNILSGLKEGPGVAEMIEILGKKNTITRLLDYINKQNR